MTTKDVSHPKGNTSTRGGSPLAALLKYEGFGTYVTSLIQKQGVQVDNLWSSSLTEVATMVLREHSDGEEKFRAFVELLITGFPIAAAVKGKNYPSGSKKNQAAFKKAEVPLVVPPISVMANSSTTTTVAGTSVQSNWSEEMDETENPVLQPDKYGDFRDGVVKGVPSKREGQKLKIWISMTQAYKEYAPICAYVASIQKKAGSLPLPVDCGKVILSDHVVKALVADVPEQAVIHKGVYHEQLHLDECSICSSVMKSCVRTAAGVMQADAFMMQSLVVYHFLAAKHGNDLTVEHVNEADSHLSRFTRIGQLSPAHDGVKKTKSKKQHLPNH
jgi:hypothetical protein